MTMTRFIRRFLEHRTTEITRREFWETVSNLPPLIRLGSPTGAGAFLNSEPWDLRTCTVTGKEDYTYSANFVLEDERTDKLDEYDETGHEVNEDERYSRYFSSKAGLTLHEFKALCDQVLMPDVGLCEFEWGKELLDDNGNLRTDLKFPIHRETMRMSSK